MKEIHPIKNFNVVVDAPPAKAHTLRAVVLAALASGRSTITNPLLGEDQLHLIECIEKMGVAVAQDGNELQITGCGGVFSPVAEVLDVGESGVSMNFLCSLACLADKGVVLTGAKSLCERPVEQVVSGLTQLGCRIDYLEEPGFPPVRVVPAGILGGSADIQGKTTSQYFSSIAIASPFAASPVILNCIDNMTERPYFDITVAMMAEFGAHVKNEDYRHIEIPCGQSYQGRTVQIEGDFSSASFFFLAAPINKSKVTVRNVSSRSEIIS